MKHDAGALIFVVIGLLAVIVTSSKYLGPRRRKQASRLGKSHSRFWSICDTL